MQSKLIASIITTTRHNVGDDFVRAGIQSLISLCLEQLEDPSQRNIDYRFIHKHSPITSVYGFSRVRSTRISRCLEPLARYLRLPNAISSANILIQSGAPIYWHHKDHSSCENNEWYDSLIRKRYGLLHNMPPLLNLAGGSCQRYYSDGSEFLGSPRTLDYIHEFYSCSSLTTLRDPLAQTILALTGNKAEVLPCTSIFARDFHNISPKSGEVIVLNFMQNGGHFTFGQPISSRMAA